MPIRVLEAQILGPRKSQQDRCTAISSGASVVLAVFDGMGGHSGGEQAAGAACEAFEYYVETYAIPEVEVGRWAERGLQLAHTAACRASSGGATATVVALMPHQNRGVCIWAGDSPAGVVRGLRRTELVKPHGFLNQLNNGIGSVFSRPYFDKTRFEFGRKDVVYLGSDGILPLLHAAGPDLAHVTRSADLMALVQSVPVTDNTTVLVAQRV